MRRGDRTARRGWRLCQAALPLFLLLRPALAHELGVIRTNASFRRDGTYRIEVVIDRAHLPPGFGSKGRLPTRYGPLRNVPREHQRTIGKLMAEVVDGSEIFFDGRRVKPEVEWAGSDPNASELVVGFSGPIPGGAKSVVWGNALPLGTYLLTIRTEGQTEPARQWLKGGETSRPVSLDARVVPPRRREVAWTYLKLGYTHILPKGTDHILFVLGVFLLSTRWKPVLLQVTAFTIAHTITLALTIYGIVSLSPAIVEPLIALSIVYVAVENVVTSELKPWRVGLVFAFGLLHGMGFAGVLSELGLPRSQFLTALLCFNAGVELGQLTVILAAFVLLGLPFREKPWYRATIVIPLSLAIAAVGLFWAVQRWGQLSQ